MTQITIIVDDKTVYVDGKGLPIPDLDWTVFKGDPESAWDDIHAVQFDTARKQGYVEYKIVPTDQLGRPDIKPPDWAIGDTDFEAHFAWVLPIYEAKRLVVEAEIEAARLKAAEGGDVATVPAVDAASKNEVEDLKAQLAEQKAKVDGLLKAMAEGRVT